MSTASVLHSAVCILCLMLQVFSEKKGFSIFKDKVRPGEGGGPGWPGCEGSSREAMSWCQQQSSWVQAAMFKLLAGWVALERCESTLVLGL